MTTVVCPGSYDPVTYGHLDVIERAAQRFDRVVVACLHNMGKQTLLSLEERLELLREVTRHLENVEVGAFEGLLVDFCRERDITAIVKGLRNASDFDFELPMAHMNARLTGVETVFVATAPELAFVSSSLVKEVAAFGGDVTPLLSPAVLERLRVRLEA